MAAEVAFVFLLFLALTVGGGLVLYLLVRSESERSQVMDRDAAEQTVRRDARDDEQ